jgi:copper chaperone CopZ
MRGFFQIIPSYVCVRTVKEPCSGPGTGNELHCCGGEIMKKKFKLNEIDCANCALKLEESIKEISGVKDAKVNYMMQKLTVEADEADMDGVVEKVLAACRRLEPDMEVTAI